MKGSAEGDGFLGVGEGCSEFRFCGRGHYMFLNFGRGFDGAIVDFEAAWSVTEVEMATSAAAGVGLGKIGGVTVDF